MYALGVWLLMTMSGAALFTGTQHHDLGAGLLVAAVPVAFVVRFIRVWLHCTPEERRRLGRKGLRILGYGAIAALSIGYVAAKGPDPGIAAAVFAVSLVFFLGSLLSGILMVAMGGYASGMPHAQPILTDAQRAGLEHRARRQGKL